MAGRRPRVQQAPDPDDKTAWAAFVHWLRHYSVRGVGRGLQVKTILGWRPVAATDWVLRLPGRELHVMPDERWRQLPSNTKVKHHGPN